MKNLTFLPGKPLPLGATVVTGGVNFSVFTRNGTDVILELFENPEDGESSYTYQFDPDLNKTGDIWHVFVSGLEKNALYLYRVDGPFRPNEGLRFNQHKFLLDPYAKALTPCSIFKNMDKPYQRPPHIDPDLAYSSSHTALDFPKCIVIDDDEFDWQGDRPLNYPLQHCVVYEAHVKGLTVDKSSGLPYGGTYRGVIEAIPYLKELGITSLELLPINEFDEYENTRKNPRTGERLENYWGYSTIAFFAPKATYAFNQEGPGPVHEFKEMVRELHKAGIEVILDIVFNHTAEGNERGVTMSFRGFDNPIYYMLEDNKRYYRNYSGCGNTVNCNHPVVRTLILDCLRYWVTEMHIDGFRFDLGSILGRGPRGELLDNPPMLERIAEDPVLRQTKIIAEAWDAGGAYQVGWFPGGRWAEWNDRFRDEVRMFWRGDSGALHNFATRITGSADLYLRDGRKPFHSINFLSSHDGFTLNDLVTYNGKHNEENGEENRDGQDRNCSYNYGFEGPSVNPEIEDIRNRQVKNLMLSLLISLGTPMLQMGDEIRRTQGGNNNAYCQDNEISWMNWDFCEKYADVFRFVREVIRFRRNHPVFLRTDFLTGRNTGTNAAPDISWFGTNGQPADWLKQDQFIAFRLMGNRASTFADSDDNDFYVIYNASVRDITVTIPPSPPGKKWFRAIDTSRMSPEDILEPGREEMLPNQEKYVILARCSVVLISRIV
ncbi:glycogen debranching protein GlgX [Brucepastera parasyntrophica]|uniref:glycogen debranching protein GlgX n=1 Tax=Brucepastera parasyntrophica TaxID=2880008 RepID=UPI002108B57A|nr:glycogen debranching protein GlgX [Brucepastera parasyntrophica]ULQ61067.1 glycogen debranching protein GlgX [Brucepastera parasyntrophica]